MLQAQLITLLQKKLHLMNSLKSKVWSSFQKEIPDDNYYFARSCIRQNIFPASEEIFLKIVQKVLNKDIFDDANQTTCTGIAYHSGLLPLETTMTVVARQFALMTEAGYQNFVCSCVTSFGIYTEVVETWKHNPGLEFKIREILKQTTGKEFNIPKSIIHSSDIIYKFRKEIANKSIYKLIDKEHNTPLKIVDHVGCHYAKIFPEHGVGGAEYPQILSALTDEWGGEQIDYPERRHCCGFGFRQYLLKSNRGYSLTNSKIKFDSMSKFEPDLIITNCPGCTMFLDRWQYVLKEANNISYANNNQGIPVLSFEELAGILLGFRIESLGFEFHQTSIKPILDKIGIVS